MTIVKATVVSEYGTVRSYNMVEAAAPPVKSYTIVEGRSLKAIVEDDYNV
jgi:hypothetical protein